MKCKGKMATIQIHTLEKKKTREKGKRRGSLLSREKAEEGASREESEGGKGERAISK